MCRAPSRSTAPKVRSAGSTAPALALARAPSYTAECIHFPCMTSSVCLYKNLCSSCSSACCACCAKVSALAGTSSTSKQHLDASQSTYRDDNQEQMKYHKCIHVLTCTLSWNSRAWKRMLLASVTRGLWARPTTEPTRLVTNQAIHPERFLHLEFRCGAASDSPAIDMVTALMATCNACAEWRRT